MTTSGWAGNVGNCTQGTTSAAFKQSVLDRLNSYRAFAGLPPVGLFTDTKVSDTQRAALMMSANNALNHSPPTNWKCYTAAGRNAAYYSNLALGAYGFDAIDLYMDDPGTGNGAVGHRRWLLFPTRRTSRPATSPAALPLRQRTLGPGPFTHATRNAGRRRHLAPARLRAVGRAARNFQPLVVLPSRRTSSAPTSR